MQKILLIFETKQHELHYTGIDVFLCVIVFLLRYLGKFHFLLKRRFHDDFKVYLFTELQNKLRGFI